MEFMIFGILCIPIAISLFCQFVLKWDICAKEFLIQIVLGTLMLLMIWGIGNSIKAMDQQIVSGSVVSKRSVDVYCPGSNGYSCTETYQCNCRDVCSGTGKNRSCTRVCDTCYHYSMERNWEVNTTLYNNKSFLVSRVDNQGLREPKNFTAINLQDPISGKALYDNWVKASAGSLFKKDAHAVEKYKAKLIDYPDKIYGMYRINRVVHANGNSDTKLLNEILEKQLGLTAPTKQINIIIVVVHDLPRDYALALRRHWEGFNKNDSVIFVGLSKGIVQWSEVMSWAKFDSYNIKTRSFVESFVGTEFSKIDPNQFVAGIINVVNTNWVRRPMKDFEYLKGDIPPPNWLIILSIILAVLFGAITSVVFHTNENYSTNRRFY